MWLCEVAPRHGFKLRSTASFPLDLDCSVVHKPIIDPFLLFERWEWMTRLRPQGRSGSPKEVFDMTEEEINRHLPIVPHGTVTDTDCPGCLVVGLKDSKCAVLCNECGALIGSVPAVEVEGFFQGLYKRSR